MQEERLVSGGKIGSYTLHKRIGVGGMGEVWHATRSSGGVFAIKFAHLRLANETYFADFARQEASIKLDHPNIVHVEEILELDGLPAIVFAFVEGQNLENEIYGDSTTCELGTPISVQRAVAISGDILAALDFAHQKGLVHRDVKSSNILVERSTGKALLSDFGLVMDVTVRRMTRYGMMGGSVPYMSPEQIKDNRSVEFKSDIYSFGIVLYEMLTGVLPFRVEPGDTEDPDYLIKHKHRFSVAAPPSAVNPQVPHWIDRIVLKALEKDKDKRYSSCQEFAAALRAPGGNTASRRVVVHASAPGRVVAADPADPVEEAAFHLGNIRLTAGQIYALLPWALIGCSAFIVGISLFYYFR